LVLPFKAAYMFRPGFIQPVDGARSGVGWYRAIYAVAGPLVPIMRRLFPGQIVTTAEVGRAMLGVVGREHAKRLVESRDISRLAQKPV
jgi:hypothetical protein